MGVELVTTAYGRPAAEALHRFVATAKQGDPLRPASVVVPTNYVGVSTRRLLASGVLGPITPEGQGVAAVTFLTLYRLAELLGAPRLAATGRRPVSTPVVAAAIRSVLAVEPGVFAHVTEHPTTEESLVRADKELAELPREALDTLAAQSRRARDVVRIHREARKVLASSWYDEHDLMDAAVAALGEGSPVLPGLGDIALYLPERIPVPAARLVRAVIDHTPVTVIAGMTGHERADATVRDACARLGLDVSAETPSPITPAHGTKVVSCSDADEEVRAVVRHVVDAVRAGIPLDRQAILYGADEPYARLVHEHLNAAGIAHNGAAVRTLTESLLGRTLLGLLALPDRDFRRQDVLTLLASAPLRDEHRRLVPSSAWERISRRAGIVRGRDQWRDRLTRHATELAREAEEERRAAEREPRLLGLEKERGRTEAFAAFVDDLFTDLDPARVPARWPAKVAWAHGLIQRYVGDERLRTHWPADEVEAAEQVERALDRLAALDAVEQAPSLAVFRRTLELELDTGLGRLGRFGDGVFVGRVPLAFGVDLDHVVVLGLAEGTFPTRTREDSLLPDAERAVLDGELPLRGARPDDDHRALLAVLAATSGERVLCFPRGDLRRSTERMPSRFWLDTVETLRGGPRLYADELDGLDEPWYTHVPSFVGGLRDLTFPATGQDYALAALLGDTQAGRRLDDHPFVASDRVLAGGLATIRARRSRAFTRFDGNLAGRAVPAPTEPDVVVSPTRLEAWAECPHAYFMESVLRVEIPEPPEELWEISPLDRGNIVHRALETFLAEVLARPDDDRPRPDDAWTDEDRRRLHAIGAAVCDEYEARGLTGRDVLWRPARAQILRDLQTFLTTDAERRADQRLVPVAAELGFGFDERDPVPFPLSDGRTLHFRGSADRVDRVVGDGGGLVVVDYKTGRAYEDLAADDPTLGGTRLQLPVYSVAARAAFGDDDTPVAAAYWFVTTKGGFHEVALADVPEIRAEVDAVLRSIADGIGAGVFPAHPEEPTTRPGGLWVDCPWCDPDELGTRDRFREWERKRDAPELAGYVALAEPEVDEVSIRG